MELKTGISPKDMVLIYKGEALVDSALVKDCNLEPNGSITLLDIRDTPAEMSEVDVAAA